MHGRLWALNSLVALAVTVMLLAGAQPASAAPQIDQVGPGPYNLIVTAFNASDHEAQTFVAGKTGLLVRVDMPIYLGNSAAGDLIVKITGQTLGGLPDETNVLATQVLPQSQVPVLFPNPILSIIFQQPAAIVAGTGYAIVLTSTAGTLDCGSGQCPGQSYAVLTSVPNDTYAAGGVCIAQTPAFTYTCLAADMLFTTYVEPQTNVAPAAHIQFDPATRQVQVVGREVPGGASLTTTGAIPPAVCQSQRTGLICVYRVTDLFGNSLTLTLQITSSSTQTRVRVLSVQAPGKPAVTPLTHEAVFDHALAALQLSSLTQTLSVTDPGPPASSRQVRATWTEAAGQTTVTHVRPAAPNQVLPGRQLLSLVVEASGRISIELPSPI